ncbi:MAG: hypothetical protein WCG74_12535 [Sediminibacterium sp.]
MNNNLNGLIFFLLLSSFCSCKKDSPINDSNSNLIIRTVYNTDGTVLLNDTIDFNKYLGDVALESSNSSSFDYYTILGTSYNHNLQLATKFKVTTATYNAKYSLTLDSPFRPLSFSATDFYLCLFSQNWISSKSYSAVATSGNLVISKAENGSFMFGSNVYLVSGTWEGNLLFGGDWNYLKTKRGSMRMINVPFGN